MNAKTYDAFGQRSVAKIQTKLRPGISANLTREGRIYYCNHGTQTSSWLPPADDWDYKSTGLPYGWETAIDKEGKSYYINHLNKTTTYEDPRKDSLEEPPQPRQVELFRDPEMGFGFVAGSEKPVIVRFVTDGGPSESKLLPGDQILKVNGEDVKMAPRDHVIELVRACKLSVLLIVCQPHTDNSTRKSALLSAAKKARLKTNPSRVRFAEGVVINGSPLFSPSNFSGESCVPFMPNVLKVFLENGQTKSFKYDSSTTVQDVLESLQQKLSIRSIEHFSLVVEHIKSLRRNKLTLLDPKESLAKIAARPGAQHLRCLFRVTFVPKDAYEMLREDCVAFEYLYTQCCNDVVQERFAPELKYDIALRLAALHMQQHALATVTSTSSSASSKISVKALEKDCGFEKFVPVSLMETMKRKELRKLLSHFVKLNQNLCAPDQKTLTALQAKLHYLRIIGELPSYGAKCFTTNLRDSNIETIILVSPKFGISKIIGMRNSMPHSLSAIEDLSGVVVTREDELSHQVELQMKDIDRENILLSMEDRDAEELVLLLQGYYRLLSGRPLSVQRESDRWVEDAAPSYHTRHTVQEAGWNYPALPDSDGDKREFSVDLATSPPLYHPSKPVTANGHVSTGTRADQDNGVSMGNSRPVVPQPPKPILPTSMVDWNMNRSSPDNAANHTEPSINSLELLEDAAERASARASVLEARNKEALRRVAEMQRIVQTAEMYLTETEAEEDEEETESVQGSDRSGNVGGLKAADSLLLLTQVGLTPPTIDSSIVLGAAARFRLSADISGDHSESDDTDSLSTPSDSPSHRARPSSSRTGPPTRPPPPPPVATPPPTPPLTLGVNGSSFGLHSPDGIPLDTVVSSGSCNGGHVDRSNGHGPNLRLSVQDYLQKLHRESRLPYEFAEGTLYLDPDIIDLTMIPPPMTPDHEEAAPVPATPVNFPPTPFADRQSLAAELELLNIDADSNLMGLYSLQAKRQHAPLATTEDTEDSDVGSSCATHSSTIWTAQDNLDIESFIASVTVPPPPVAMPASVVTEATPPPSVQALSADELTAFIIPPPPFGTAYEDDSGQEEVISRLQAATASVRLVVRGDHHTCTNVNNNNNTINNNNSNSSFSDNSSTVSSEMGGAQADTEEDALDVASSRSSPASVLSLSRLRPNQGVLANSMEKYTVQGSRSPSYLGVTISNGMDVTSSSDDGHPEPRWSSSNHFRANHTSATLRPRGPRNARPMASYLDAIQWERSIGSDNMESPNRVQTIPRVMGGMDDKMDSGQRRIMFNSTSTRTESSTFHTSTTTRRFAETEVNYKDDEDEDEEGDEELFYESESQRTGTILRSPSKYSKMSHQIGESSQSIGNGANGDPEVNRGTYNVGIGRTMTTLMDGAGTPPLRTSSPKQRTKGDYHADRRDSFYGAEEVIGNLLVHLENTVGNSRIIADGHSNEISLITARDTLVTASKQFVNASKLFVKSATESEDRLVESLVTCLELMQRMFAFTERLVSVGGSWHVHSQSLVLKVKDVALTFLQTLQAASEAVGRPMNDPKLVLLMQQATTLAAVLTALMRTLRGIAP